MKTYTTVFPYFPEEDIESILVEFRAILSGEKMLSMAEKVALFQKQFAQYVNTKYAVATNSCTSALELALGSLNLSSDDEVIVPVQTFVATGSAVLRAGAKVVFCDVDDNFLLDFNYLKKAITDKTKAVIIVHFAGLISNQVLDIKTYLHNKGIILIEDAAHAAGASFNDLRAGSIGDIGCHSFYATKNITTAEGGMITTNNKFYYEQYASMSNRGIDIHKNYEIFSSLGSNCKMTEMQAILGIYQLKRLDDFVRYRNQIAQIYRTELSLVIQKGKVRLQDHNQNTLHAYWRFIVFLEDSKRCEMIKQKMCDFGIKVDAPYSPLLHHQPVFNSRLKFDNAEALAKRHISLPVHMKISFNDAKVIVNYLLKCLND